MAKTGILFLLFVSQVSLIFADFSRDDCNKGVEGSAACRAHFLVYKYNPAKGVCEQTVYGGCNPTNNNFARKEDCERIAKSVCNSKTFFTPEDCNKDVQGAKCGVTIAVYRWDPKRQGCVQAVYGGCNPTNNNFRDIKDCLKYADPVCRKSVM